MFAAFPGWYATMFSGFYPALILLLVALIVRGVVVRVPEHAGQGRAGGGRGLAAVRSAACWPPLLIGVALGGLLHGVPIDSSQEFTGGLRRPADPLRRCESG